MQKSTLNDWLLRGFLFVCTALLSVLVYIGKDVREDVKLLTQNYPVLQEKVNHLENRTNRLEDKVFAQKGASPAKHEPEITLQTLLNNSK